MVAWLEDNDPQKRMMFVTVVQLAGKELFVGMVFSSTTDENGYDHWRGNPATKEYDSMDDAFSHLLIVHPNLDIMR